jgi:hypothetical protein
MVPPAVVRRAETLTTSTAMRLLLPEVDSAGVQVPQVAVGLGAGVCAVGAGVGLSTGAAVGFPGATDGRRVGAALTRQKPQERSQ